MAGHQKPRKARQTIDAATLLEQIAAGKSWAEIQEGWVLPRRGQSKMNAGELLTWAVEQGMPEELIEQGRNIWLERYRRLLGTQWQAAMGGDRAAIEIIRGIARDVRQMCGLDAPAKIKADLTITEIERTIVDPKN